MTIPTPTDELRRTCRESYRPCVRCSVLERREENPGGPMSLAEAWIIHSHGPDEHPDMDNSIYRFKYVRTFGYPVITAEVADFIAGFSPLLDIGAGTGYLAMELSRRGADVVAVDPDTSEYFPNSPRWHPVIAMAGLEALERYPERNVILSWPSMNEWPTEIVKRITPGRHLIYVGEEEHGCTAETATFRELRKRFTLEEERTIPRFCRINDFLQVWRRK